VIAGEYPVPTTASLAPGLDVPIPTLALELMRITSTPPSTSAIVSAAGKNIPVFVSPEVVRAGAPSVPAERVVTPVADRVVNAPEPAVVEPIEPGEAKVAPLKLEALRFATFVVDATVSGAVPVVMVLCTVVNTPVVGVVAPTVPFKGPEKPSAVMTLAAMVVLALFLMSLPVTPSKVAMAVSVAEAGPTTSPLRPPPLTTFVPSQYNNAVEPLATETPVPADVLSVTAYPPVTEFLIM